MTDVAAPIALPEDDAPIAAPAPASPAAGRRYDRSIIEGPLRSAVWKLAWPTMLANLIGGLQGFIDNVMVGHMVGFRGSGDRRVVADFHYCHCISIIAVHRDGRARRARRRRR